MAIMGFRFGRQRCPPLPVNWKILAFLAVFLAVVNSHPVPGFSEDGDLLEGEKVSTMDLQKDDQLQGGSEGEVLPGVAPPQENSPINDVTTAESKKHESKHHRPREVHHTSKKHDSSEPRHHDSAVRVSSVFPVDPDELEFSLHDKKHHGSSGGGPQGQASLVRRKRHSNLVADMENMNWVDDVEEKEFPEDVFHYYVRGGEGAKYGIETAPAPVQQDPAVHDWFYSELDSNAKESPDDFIPSDVAVPEMEFLADLERKVPVHVVTKLAQPMQDGAGGGGGAYKIPSQQQLEENFAPVIADLIAREQSQNWEELYKKFPTGDVGRHPPTYNQPTAFALTFMAAFMSFMAGLTIYMCRPKHEERQARANAMKPLYDEPFPAETGDMTLEDMESLIE